MPVSDQGITAGSRYQLIPRTLIFVTCREDVLLIKGSIHKRLWPNLYNGIGGHVERGESIGESARRELLEETGLDVPGMSLVGVVSVDTGDNTGVGIFVLKGELEPRVGMAGTPLQVNEEGILEWVPVDQLDNLPLVGDLHELLPKVLQAQPEDAPFFAVYSYNELGHLEIRFTD